MLKIIKSKNQVIFIIAIMLICLAKSQQLKSNDMENLQILKNRILAPFFKREIKQEKIKKFLADQKPDGSWKDVLYNNKAPAIWKTTSHLSRVMNLALAYKAPKSPFKGRKSIKENTLKSLDYWLQPDFKNKNWWWNVIDIPRRLSEIGLVMEEELSENQKKKMIAIIKRSNLKGNPSWLTGQNLVWIARNNINRGIFEKNVKTKQQGQAKYI
ncbi:MAG: hypothetical protein COA79_01305 [Planctomycetota bacterium]|nr:MAG: hypothetical protein COA79_01305 [Planctomycetota bacterium]